MLKHPALVGIVPRKNLWEIIQEQKWYHILPEALTKDRKRNNQLTSYGWQVLRFLGKEINGNLRGCFEIIERTIGNLGGLAKLSELQREIY